MWRILGYSLHGHSPAVQRLQIHLPGQHNVTFNKNADLLHVARRNNDSQLMAYFKLNQVDKDARKYTYAEIPEHYTYDQNNRKWNKRKIKEIFKIARIYFVHPKDGERFCLRALLLNVKGATSFEHLRTVNNILCDTFRDAALALHLLEDDREWDLCLKEASSFKFSKSLRHLFCVILVNCAPSEPRKLWDNHAINMYDDILSFGRKKNAENGGLQTDDEVKIEAMKNVLWAIDSDLKALGSSLAAFPTLPQDISDSILRYIPKSASDHSEKSREELAKLADSHIQDLNAEQRGIFDIIVASVSIPLRRRKTNLYFIDGPGGTGKSFLYNTLIEQISGVMKKNVVVLASSGIAALILHGGRTAHSVFKIPIPVFKDSTCNITREQQVGSIIHAADLIIWDEAPMMHRHVFESVDRIVRHIMDRPLVPFGGKIVVFGGDFRQVLPVVVQGSQSQIEGACLKMSSTIWPKVKTLKLTRNMRVKVDGSNDFSFVDFLLRVGEGKEQTFSFDNSDDYIRIPDHILFTPHGANLNDEHEIQLIRTIYPNISNGNFAPQDIKRTAILTTLNKDANHMNDLATTLFPGEATEYLGQDSIPDSNTNGVANYPTEYLNSLDPTGLPPYKLVLKVGMPIILLRNVDQKKGLCNGTRLIVRRLKPRCIMATILTGPFATDLVFIPRVPIVTTDDKSSPILFKRRQFPVRPAFAMTINKSQGQTLENVGLYLPTPVFTHGQLYVALSRCTEEKNLKVLIVDGSIPGVEGTYTRNVVYKRVL